MPMTAEGAQAQPQEQGGGMAEGLQMLQQGTQALLESLTQAQAPEQIVQLAQTAAQAIGQIAQAMGGEGQAEQPGAPQ